MTIDRQVVAEHVRQLRATLPATGDLLAALQQVTEATRAVVRVDGAGLTLVHEDGRPQWVGGLGRGDGAARTGPARLR